VAQLPIDQEKGRKGKPGKRHTERESALQRRNVLASYEKGKASSTNFGQSSKEKAIGRRHRQIEKRKGRGRVSAEIRLNKRKEKELSPEPLHAKPQKEHRLRKPQ